MQTNHEKIDVKEQEAKDSNQELLDSLIDGSAEAGTFYISTETAEAIGAKAESDANLRQLMLDGASAWDSYISSFENGRENCLTCSASIYDAYPPNKKIPWLGVGEDEHCPECGAFSARHSHRYRNISSRSVSVLVADLARVEEAYVSSICMTKEQIKKNRKYFKRILSELSAKEPDYDPHRYERSTFRRNSEALFDYLIELATKVYGSKQKAIGVYGGVAKEFDDLHFFIDEVKREIDGGLQG